MSTLAETLASAQSYLLGSDKARWLNSRPVPHSLSTDPFSNQTRPFHTNHLGLVPAGAKRQRTSLQGAGQPQAQQWGPLHQAAGLGRLPQQPGAVSAAGAQPLACT